MKEGIQLLFVTTIIAFFLAVFILHVFPNSNTCSRINEGFKSSISTISSCPSNSKSYYDKKGNLNCCSGEVNGDACTGTIVCTFNSSLSNIPFCENETNKLLRLQQLSKNMESSNKNRRVHPLVKKFISLEVIQDAKSKISDRYTYMISLLDEINKILKRRAVKIFVDKNIREQFDSMYTKANEFKEKNKANTHIEIWEDKATEIIDQLEALLKPVLKKVPKFKNDPNILEKILNKLLCKVSSPIINV